jgi:hypothetical protein
MSQEISQPQAGPVHLPSNWPLVTIPSSTTQKHLCKKFSRDLAMAWKAFALRDNSKLNSWYDPNTLSRLEIGEEIDYDLVDYLELKDRQEQVEILTESETFDLAELGIQFASENIPDELHVNSD